MNTGWLANRWSRFRPCPKRGSGVGKTKVGKGAKVRVVADGQGLPIGLHGDRAQPHEITLAEWHQTDDSPFMSGGRASAEGWAATVGGARLSPTLDRGTWLRLDGRLSLVGRAL